MASLAIPGRQARQSGMAKALGWEPLSYHLKSIWLFTFSDLKTIVGPATTFGVLHALCAPIFGLDTAPVAISQAVLKTTFWTWINLLPLVIDNQRQPRSIAEDRLNKPWRPMPSNRLTSEQAKRLMFMFYSIAFLTSLCLGGVRQCLALMALCCWYNDHGGAAGLVSRNFLNACGIICYCSGAMEIALGSHLRPERILTQWFLIIGGVIFSTVQVQDLCDQEGDRAAGRNTLPLVVGDGPSRWMTALPMAAWSLICPWYWNAPVSVYVLFSAMGFVIAFRVLSKREVVDDQRAFTHWNLWMMFLYSLPLLQYCMSS